MYYTPSDLRERYAFIERTMDHAREVLAQPEIYRALGGAATQFINYVSSSFVANISDGEIQIPQGDYDEDALPVVAIRDDETFIMSDDFEYQTPIQERNTLMKFMSWGADDSQAKFAYRKFIGEPIQKWHKPLVNFNPLTTAMTGTYARFGSNRALSEIFPRAPSRGIAMIKLRPALMLRISSGVKKTEADVIAHELVHLKQIKEQPVDVFSSQKSVDMRALRGELEAYHVGSILTAREVQIRGNKIISKPEESYRYIQMMVEITRQKHGIDPIDPYRPSPALLKKLAEQDADKILHGWIDYEELEAMLQHQPNI